MNYREYYKDYFGIDFSSDYEVHHLDMDRKNNSIDNLLLLPKELHCKYHSYLNSLGLPNGEEKGTVKKIDFSIFGNHLETGSYQRAALENIIQILNECAKWYDYKDYLMGRVGNIHHIKLEVENK